MSIHQNLYVSSALKGLDSMETHQIVSTANQFNSKNNITGILLFRAGILLELLEGEKSVAESLYES